MGLSLLKFREKWKGRRCSGYTDKGGQCIDIVREWLRNRFGNPYHGIPSVGAASQMYARASTTKWRKVPYRRHADGWWKGPDGRPFRPPNGSILVYAGHEGNIYGHVAIVRRSPDGHNSETFDQNWSRYQRCTDEIHRHARDRVIGCLIPR
jgi:hypothetical protein